MSAPGTDTERRSGLPGGGWRLEIVKLAVSVSLLWLILRRFSAEELWAEVQRTHAPALAVPFAIIVASNLLGAVQWGWILRSAGVDIGFGRVLRAYWIGLFLNNFLLGSVGGDVYKVYTLGRGAGVMGRVAGATIVDRMVALAALCALAVVAAMVALPASRLPSALVLFVLVCCLTVMTAAAILLHARMGAALAAGVGRLRLGRPGERLVRVLGHLGTYRDRTRILNGAFAISLVIQSGRVAAHYGVAQAMGWGLGPLELGKFFLVIPVLGLLIALPVSVGGWGVREWAGVALFAPMGHGGEEAVTLLALTALLSLCASLAGGVVLLSGPRRAPVVA